jgi:hypothetical protein
MGLLYGRAGRLNTSNAGFRPGQMLATHPGLLPVLLELGAGAPHLVAHTLIHHPARAGPPQVFAASRKAFLCLITPLCSYLYGGLYGGLY